MPGIPVITTSAPDKAGMSVSLNVKVTWRGPLTVAAAAGVLYAAWQTLRADDELWVADDPLRAPDA